MWDKSTGWPSPDEMWETNHALIPRQQLCEVGIAEWCLHPGDAEPPAFGSNYFPPRKQTQRPAHSSSLPLGSNQEALGSPHPIGLWETWDHFSAWRDSSPLFHFAYNSASWVILRWWGSKLLLLQFPQLTANLVRQRSNPCDPAANALTQEESGRISTIAVTWERCCLSLQILPSSNMSIHQGKQQTPDLCMPCMGPQATEMSNYHWTISFRGMHNTPSFLSSKASMNI